MALQQLDQQAALQRAQLAAAVVLLQHRSQLLPQAGQAGRRGTVGNVEQGVEKLLPQLAVGDSAEGGLPGLKTARLISGRRFAGDAFNLLKTPLVFHTPPSLVTCM